VDSFLAQLIGGLVSGAVGFSSAYLLARRQRRWDAEDAAASARGTLIQSVRIPLEIIRDEIHANQGFYFTKDVEERISRALREAIYALQDDLLIRTFEEAVPPLRGLAWGSDRESSGQKCMPKIEAMLSRLNDLAATVRPRRG